MPALHNKAQCRTTWAGPSGQSEVVLWPDCSSHPNAETVESCTHTTSKLYHMGLTNSVLTQWQCILLQNGYRLHLSRYTVSPWHNILLLTEVPGKWSASALKRSGATRQVIYCTHSWKPAATKHHKEQKPHASGLNTIPGLGIKSTGFQGKSKQSVLVS